jgi:hypothetical protein
MSMVSMHVKVLKNSLPKMRSVYLQGGLYVVHREAQETVTLAKEKYVPVVSGDLRNSDFVNEPRPTSRTYGTCEFGFGRKGSRAERYALRVHELPASAGQGKSKYLQKAVMERAGKGYEQRIGRMFQQWLKGQIK